MANFLLNTGYGLNFVEHSNSVIGMSLQLHINAE